MGKPLITGIDIGHHSIKAVVLRPSRNNYAVVGYKELPIDAGIFAENHTLNHQKIVKKLKQLKKDLPMFSSQIVLSVPDSAVISKVLQIDSDIDEREVEFAILQAFSHQSPFPVEELNLDYVPVFDGPSNSNSLSYQVYASKKDIVESRLNAAEKAGFKPILVDVHAHGLVEIWNLASESLNKSDWILLDIGHTQSTMCLDFADKSPFCREMAVGTRLLESFAKDESVDNDASSRFANNVVERLQRNLQMLASSQGSPVQGVWLTGGGSAVAEVAEKIVQTMNLECETLDVLRLMNSKVRTKRKASSSSGATFGTAAGLALRGINWMEADHVA